jgi:hypothetical protein
MEKTKLLQRCSWARGGVMGGRNRAVPADTVDTLRGERKGDPQHKVVGTNVPKGEKC